MTIKGKIFFGLDILLTILNFSSGCVLLYLNDSLLPGLFLVAIAMVWLVLIKFKLDKDLYGTRN